MFMKIVRFATACCVSLILLVSLVGCSEDEKKAETKESANSSMTTTKSPTSKKETEKGHASESLDKEKKELYQKKAEEDIALLNEGKIDELKKQFGDVMAAATTDKDLEQITDLIKRTGDFVKVKEVSVKKVDDEYETQTTVEYSEGTLEFSINYNEENQLNGLYVK